MNILFVLLSILKVLGIVLLVLMAVLLFALAIILLSPIRYKIFGEGIDELNGSCDISWLFGAIKFVAKFKTGDGVNISLKVFGKPLLGEGVKKKKKKSKKQPTPDAGVSMRSREAKPEKEISKEKSPKIETLELPKKEVSSKTIENIPPKLPHTRVKVDEIIEKETDLLPLDDVDELPDDFFDTNTEKKDKGIFKQILEIDQKKVIIKASFKLIRRILKGVLPNNFYFKATIGLGDPALTGYLCGVAGLLKMQFGNSLDITGDFKNLTFKDAKIAVKGKIVIGYLLYAVICFIKTKPVWRLIIQFWKGKR